MSDAPETPRGDPDEVPEQNFDATIQSVGAPKGVPDASSESGEQPGKETSSIDVDRTIARAARPVPKQRPDEYVPSIPDVTITGTIGTGGQGVVFRGHQDYLERDVAVKVLHRHIDPSFSKRFRREAKILAGLHHTNIVTCHQAGVTDDDHCYMVMEYIDGPDLFDHVQASGPLDECDALDLVRDVALALEHGLESAIIHRDVKPQNVLLQRSGSSGRTSVGAGATATSDARPGMRAKLADLGLARCTEDSAELPNLTTQGAVMGTPTTMAPEQFDAPDDVDHRTDIYGLGCVLFFALTGKPAFEGATITEIYRKKTTREVPRMLAKVPGLSAGARRLLARMMAPDAKDRPQTYHELLEGIDRARSGECAPRRAGRFVAVAAVLGIAVAALFATGVLGDDREAAGAGGSASTAAATAATPRIEAPPNDAGPAATQAGESVSGEDPDAQDTAAQDTGGQDEGTDAQDGEAATDATVPNPLAPKLEPALPAGATWLPLAQVEGDEFLAGWTGADRGQWLQTEDDHAWVRGRGDAETERPVIERACPSGDWVLEGHVGVRNTFTRGAKAAPDVAGVELERADGARLRLRVTYDPREEPASASMSWAWITDDGEPTWRSRALEVVDGSLYEKAAFDFVIESRGGALTLSIDGGDPIDMAAEDAAPTRLRLFVDAGFGSWRSLVFRGL